jgi:hypothetical protein
MSLMVHRRFKGSAWVAQPETGWGHAGEDVVPALGCFVAVLYRLTLEQYGHDTETSTHR